MNGRTDWLKKRNIGSCACRAERFCCFFLSLILVLSILPDGMASSAEDAGQPVGDQYLVHDARLYEEMVKGRYFDFWSRNSSYFMTDDNFAFENTLEAVRKKDGKAGVLIDALAARAGQKADTAACIRLLAMLAAMQGTSITQAAETMGDYDTLKTSGSYVADSLELAWDAVGVFGDLPDMAMLFGDGVQLFAEEAGIVKDTIVDSRQVLTGARLYQSCTRFLKTVSAHTGDAAMKSAADQLLKVADDCLVYTMRSSAEMAGSMVSEAAASFPEQFISMAGELLKDTRFEETAGAALDTAGSGYAKYIAPGLGTAKFIYHLIRLAGNILFDTDDTYYRYIEMEMLSEIADCLTAELDDRGFGPSTQTDGVDQAKEAADLITCLLLVRLRGEYCVKELASHNGGVMADIFMVDEDKMEDWFRERTEKLEDLLVELNMVLCTGDEVYYYFLEHYLLPEYGWAAADPLTFRVGDLFSGDHVLPVLLSEYKNISSGENGTGILSAVIRDFDGDRVNDMLVLLVQTGDSYDTPLYEVYPYSRTTRLQARLYTMQYNDRPDGYAAHDTARQGVLEQSEEQGYRPMNEIFREWARIYAEEWTTRDRFNVYEAQVLDVAEMDADSEGTVLCGICTFDGIPHIYTYEIMNDMTTDGPTVFRSWHVKDAMFVMDGAAGSLMWGQAVYAGDLNAFFGVADPQVENTPLETVYGIVTKAASPHAETSRQAIGQLSGSLLCRLTFRIGPRQGADYTITYDADDYSLIRAGLPQGRDLMPDEPVFTVETSSSQDQAEQICSQMQSLSGISLELSSDSADNGAYRAMYRSPGGSTVSLSLDDQGRIVMAAVYSPVSQENGEWVLLKDAVLNLKELALSEGLISSFSGACGFGMDSSTEEGSLSTVQIDRCIFMLQRGS
ncbi:MAG: hypothetical protein J5564_04725 [Clostridia bacterium]|nr:hypothetical protein [Clostridia bacterium]